MPPFLLSGLAPPEDPLRYDDPRLTTIKFLPEEQQTRLAYVTNRQASKKFEEDLMAWGPDLHKQHPRHTFQLAFNARWWAGDVEVVRRDRGAWHIATSAMRAVKQHGVAFEYKEIIIHLYRAGEVKGMIAACPSICCQQARVVKWPRQLSGHGGAPMGPDQPVIFV
jgi:hypothetical protein